jgi:tRNA G18 (ribose-2'-O)-methylase SpoU
VIRDIAGRQNHSVKLARKLQKKKHRRERGLLVCEGMDLLTAAVEYGAEVRDVLVRRDLVSELPRELLEHAAAGAGRTSEEEDAGVLDIGVCDLETLGYAGSLGGAADVIFTCAQPAWSLADVPMEGRVTLFVDGAGDPGNVGTIVRSAVAFGLAGVVCSPGTADPYGPKAMRAGMGAQFVLPVVTEVSASDLKARLLATDERGLRVPAVWVADPHEGDDMRDLDLQTGVIIVLGAERTGPSTEWADARRVTIPQQRFDSLNVAMAGTILAYESWRKVQGAAVANEREVL